MINVHDFYNVNYIYKLNLIIFLISIYLIKYFN